MMTRLTPLLPIAVAALLILAGAAAPTSAAAQNRYVNLNTWPVDGAYRAITAYPDDPWTWAMLGFLPGEDCPPYLRRDFDDSQETWRNPEIPVEADWAQASGSSRWVACYRGHAGTDIFTPAGVPVYAAADGTVVAVELSGQATTERTIEVHHRRLLDDGLYFEWGVRYVHLGPDLAVRRGDDVVEGQQLGTVADLDGNSHLHFEMRWVEGDIPVVDCPNECIINPWGPVWLWVDDDFDGAIDVATDVLPRAPLGENLITAPPFDGGGVLRYHTAAQFRQDARMSARVELANPTPNPVLAAVRLYPPDDPGAALACLTMIPADSAVHTLHLRGTIPAVWHNLVTEVETAAVSGPPVVEVAAPQIAYEDVTPAVRCALRAVPVEAEPPGGALREVVGAMGQAARAAADGVGR